MSLKSRYQRLRNDLKPMTFKEKVDHIWTYYKEVMFTAAVALIIVIGMLVSMLSPKKQTLIAGVACNIGINTSGQNYLTDDFADTHDHAADEYAFLSYMTYASPETVNEISSTFDTVMSVLAMAEGKTVDYFLLDEESLQAFGEEQIFMDLSEILTQEEMETYRAYMIQMKYEADESISQDDLPEDAFRAINISFMPFAQECLGATEETPVYLVFLETTPRETACRLMWEHLLNWNK